ncbi:MAG: hypothetical protein AAGA92_14960 [Planctomycetota bacterium]
MLEITDIFANDFFLSAGLQVTSAAVTLTTPTVIPEPTAGALLGWSVLFGVHRRR